MTGAGGKGRESRDGRENRRHWRNNGINTAATATGNSRGVGGKDSDKASNGDSSNGNRRPPAGAWAEITATRRATATAATVTIDSRDVGGKDSDKASNGEGSNGDRRQRGR